MKRSTTAKAAATVLTASALVAGISMAIQPMFVATATPEPTTATVETPTDTPTVGTPTDTATEPSIEEQIAQCEAMLNSKHPDAAGTCDTIGIPPASGDDVLLPPVNSYDEAYSQCIEYFDGQEMVDCISAAMAAWMGSYEPPAENDFATEAEVQDDAWAQEQEQIDKDMAELAEPEEDEPGFDCRFHGNQICYVTIGDGQYAISFWDGYAQLAWNVTD